MSGRSSDREAFQFMAGAGAQTRHYRGQSLEQSNAQDEEPCRAGVPHGSELGEKGGLSFWSVVSTAAVAFGTCASDGGHGSCDRTGSLQDAQVQSGNDPLSVNEYQKQYEEQQVKYMKKRAAKFGYQLVPS